MTWKDEYKLGNELVDAQHEELFKRVEKLNRIVLSADAPSRKQECIDAILFLKDYAVNHFAAEEAFQESLDYKFLEYHKAIHSSFVESVLDLEKELVGQNFSVPIIKEFCGFLSMWLIYHVAGADQKIISDDLMTVAEFAITVSHEDCIAESLKNVLDTVLGGSLDITPTDDVTDFNEDIKIETEYDDKGKMCFSLSNRTALALVNAITGLNMTEVDELAVAALTQLAKTVSENTAERLPGSGELKDGGFILKTRFGRISFTVKT